MIWIGLAALIVVAAAIGFVYGAERELGQAVESWKHKRGAQ